jgi:hypothetical protein
MSRIPDFAKTAFADASIDAASGGKVADGSPSGNDFWQRTV